MNEAALGDTAAWAGMEMLGKTSLALLLIIGLILLGAWVVKLVNPQRALHSQRLRVIASTGVGQRERVVIVEVENTWLVLGVASGQVSKLHELAKPPNTVSASPAEQDSFALRLGRLLQQPDRNRAGPQS